ncbi:F-box/LRR-repeat protein 20-like [Oopsacas minuta]|uniref:F-box/LRR-repeat protein 20-like n=1 Tax=Oopsacas minuta TaxID=111878 RepID=A0AAV7J9F2_9METZ|nr:F-box/LRR-repeat protein 20-like [Oopsacas minuta]
MTEVISHEDQTLTNQDSVFQYESVSSPGDQFKEDDMFALYEQIDKLRGAFQKDFASKHPWFPILEELVRTEDQYLTDIDSIIKSYVPKFELMETEIPEVITSETSKIIFINLEEIRDFHKGFYRSLKPILAQESLMKVAKLFQDQADNFKIYSEYCSNHSNSVELLVKLTKHKTVDSCLKSVQTILQHPLNLSTYLLKPVQRVLKYKLLLQSMVKHAADDSDEKALLQSAVDRMDSITKEINELQAISESKQCLLEIHEGLDTTPYEGPLTKYGTIDLQDTMLDLKAAKSRQERLIVLMDDALLICKVREKQVRNVRTLGRSAKGKRSAPYKFKDFIKLTELTFTQDDQFRGDDQAFLIHKQQSGKQMITYCLRARSIVNKNHWVSTLQDKVIASFNFAPDLFEQIMGTLKYSTSSLNSESATNSPIPQMRKNLKLIPLFPSVDAENDDKEHSFDEDRRPYTMYDYIDSTKSVPNFRRESSDILCERENVTEMTENDKVQFQIRKFSQKNMKTRPRMPTPSHPVKVSDSANGRDSGISESHEYSNAGIKQEMRELLCTMQQDYATFTGTTGERDSGVEEGEAPSQLDFMSLKRKHEGLVQSLVKNYMNVVSQQTAPPTRQLSNPQKFSTDFVYPDKSKITAGLQVVASPNNSPTKPTLSPKPPLSPKPSLSPKPPVSKISPSERNMKCKSLPRSAVNPSFPCDSEISDHTSSASDSLPASDFTSPVPDITSPTTRKGTIKVSGMKNHWEKTIDAHKEECKNYLIMSDPDNQSDCIGSCLDTIPATQPLLNYGASSGGNKHSNKSISFLSVSPSCDTGYKLIGRDCCKKNRTFSFHINALPKEILLKMFSQLDVVSLCRCASVCKLWSELAMDGSNWQKIDLFEYQINIRTSVMRPISKRCGGFLRSLSLRWCKNVEDDSLRSLTKYCPNLEELDLNGCIAITDSAGVYLSERCRKLKKLDIRSCTRITDITLSQLGQGCPLLENVSLSYCSQITNKGLYRLTQNCVNITNLHLDYCANIDDVGLTHIANNCPRLHTLSVTFCMRVGDTGVREISQKCEIEHLSLSHCDISNISLQAIGQFCPQLKSLCVSNCVRLTDTGFQALSQGCRQLENVDLEECVLISDITLNVLARYCNKIKSLTLSACDQITDQGIKSLTEGEAAVETLQILELDNCPLLTDTSIDYLMYCAPLNTVYLYDCQQISRTGIDRLKSALPDLKVQAYFAPLVTPPLPSQGRRARFFNGCRNCTLL